MESRTASIVADNVEEALKRIISYSADEEEITFEVPESPRHGLKAVLHKACGLNDTDESLRETMVDSRMPEPEMWAWEMASQLHRRRSMLIGARR